MPALIAVDKPFGEASTQGKKLESICRFTIIGFAHD